MSACARPSLICNIVDEVNLKAGVVTAVPHGLDRAPSRWTLLDLDACSTVWAPKVADSKFIYLKASADCTVSVSVE